MNNSDEGMPEQFIPVRLIASSSTGGWLTREAYRCSTYPLNLLTAIVLSYITRTILCFGSMKIIGSFYLSLRTGYPCVVSCCVTRECYSVPRVTIILSESLTFYYTNTTATPYHPTESILTQLPDRPSSTAPSPERTQYAF